MLTVNVLGPVEVDLDGSPLPITRPQVRHVLGVLAAATGEWVTVETLEFDLWGDAPPRSPRSSLQLIVNRLREALGDTDHEVIRHGTNGYRFDTDRCRIDLAVWTEHTVSARRLQETDHDGDAIASLQAARRLWRGDAFASITSSELLDRERYRLGQARTDAEVTEAETLLRLGRNGDAVQVLEQTHQRDANREDVAALLMESYRRVNRRADGLALAARVRETLRNDFGASPAEGFERAEQGLLSQGEVPPPVRHRRQVPWRPRLLEQIRRRVTDGETDQRTTRVAVTSEPRYGLSTLLRELHRSLDGDGVPTILSTTQPGQPHTLRSLVSESSLAAAGSQIAEQLLVSDQLAERGGEQSLVLIVDDVGQLDPWSIDLLRVVARATEPGITTVLGANGIGDADLAELAPDALLLELKPLTAEDIAEQIDSLLPTLDPVARHRLAGRVIDWCGGQPPAVRASLEALAIDPEADLPIPADRQLSVLEELKTIDDGRRRAVEVAALTGPEVDPVLVAAVAAEPIEEVVAALTAMTGAGVLVRSHRPGRWAFPDELTLTVVRDSIDEDEAMRLDAGAGRWLLDHGEGHADAARHLLRALPLAPLDQAVEAAATGGRELFQDGRYGEAAELLGQAAELSTGRVDANRLRHEEAVALEWSGRLDLADERLGQVVDVADRAGDVDLMAAAALAGSGHSGGTIGGQRPRLERLHVAGARLPNDHPSRGAVVVELAYERWAARQPLDPGLTEEVRHLADDRTAEAALLARRLLMLWREVEDVVPLEEARVLVGDAVAAASDRDPRRCDEAARCLVATTSVAQSWGELGLAEEWADELARFGSISGLPRARWQSMAFRVALQETRGHPERADRLAIEARDLGLSLDVPDAIPTFALHHLLRAFRAGSMAAFVDPIAQTAEQLRFPLWYAMGGLAALDDGNEYGAVESLRRASAVEPGIMDYFRIPALAMGTLLAARLERSETAGTLAKQLEPYGGQLIFLGKGGPFIGPVDWYRAVGLRAAGQRRASTELMARADASIDASRATAWEHAPIRTTSF